MEKTSLDEIEVAVNEKSYSVNPPNPDMGFPKGYLDIYEI